MSAENRLITSQHNIPSSLALLFPHEYRVYEVIAVLTTYHGESLATPLGVWRDRDKLYARIYPGTRLYEAIDSVVWCCLGVTHDPQDYLRTVTGSLATTSANLLPTRCPSTPILVECLVESRRLAWHRGALVKHITLAPVTVSARAGFVPAYSRELGLCIEALVAYTRAKHYARERKCRHALQWFRVLEVVAALAEGKTVSSSIAGLVHEARKVMESAGCPVEASED